MLGCAKNGRCVINDGIQKLFGTLQQAGALVQPRVYVWVEMSPLQFTEKSYPILDRLEGRNEKCKNLHTYFESLVQRAKVLEWRFRMEIRAYCSADKEITAKLFYDTVHSVNAADYSQAQRNAWAPRDRDLVEWDSRLSNNYSVCAESNGIVIGFGCADDTGYFDLLFVHKDYQGKGVARKIADNIEDYVCRLGIHTVTTDASITAKPFFEKRGYVVQREQCVELRGQLLVNFKMQKNLNV